MSMDEQKWKLAHGLAAESALRKTKVDVLDATIAYLKAYPAADLFAWLDAMSTMGDLCTMSYQTAFYRRELREACQPLRNVETNADLIEILAWAARLQRYYESNREMARVRSPARPISLQEWMIMPGVVREASDRALQIEVGPGQWGCGQPSAIARALAVGDEVEVEITAVRSWANFDIKVVRVTRQATSQLPAKTTGRQPGEELLPPSERTSRLTEEVLAFMSRKVDKEE